MSIAKKRELCSRAEQAYGILKVKAAEKRLCSYSEIQDALGLPHPGQLPPILQLVMEECKEKGEPLYPALVINREGRPGSGFYKQARGLGYKIDQDEPSEEAFWLWQISSRMGMHQEAFAAQQPLDSIWREQVSLLEQIGYAVNFEPLIPKAPNATSLKGKKLIKITLREPDNLRLRELLSQRPQVRRFLEKFDPTAESTERIRQLRRELQALALEHLHAEIQSLAAKNGRVEASTLPTGEDDGGSASGLPS